MSTISLAPCLNKHYLSKAGLVVDKTAKGAENMERLMQAGQYSGYFAAHLSRMQGDHEAAIKCQNISDGFGAARSVLGFTRVVFPIEKLLTGKLFFQRYTRDDIEEAHKFNYFEDFMVEGTFKKVIDEYGLPKQTNVLDLEESRSIYVAPNDPQGSYVTRDMLDIIMDVLVLAARVLSPINWLHRFKAIDLGKHAKGLGTAIGSLWAAVLTINFVQGVRDLINEQDPRKIREKFSSALRGFFTALTIAPDCFDIGMGTKAHPVAGMVGASLCLLDCLLYLLHELMIYF